MRYLLKARFVKKITLPIHKIIFLIFSLISLTVVAQDSFKRNYTYLEAGGNGLFGSVNYERQLTKEPGIGIRAGIGFYTEDGFYMTIPVGINFLFPLKKDVSFIDAGLGITWARIDGIIFGKANTSNGEHFTNAIPSIYYRRHAKNNLMWKAGFTPVFNKDATTPWIGFAIGKEF